MLEKPLTTGLRSSLHTRVVPGDTPTIVQSFDKVILYKGTRSSVLREGRLAREPSHLFSPIYDLLVIESCTILAVIQYLFVTHAMCVRLFFSSGGMKWSKIFDVTSNVRIVLVGQ